MGDRGLDGPHSPRHPELVGVAPSRWGDWRDRWAERQKNLSSAQTEKIGRDLATFRGFDNPSLLQETNGPARFISKRQEEQESRDWYFPGLGGVRELSVWSGPAPSGVV